MELAGLQKSLNHLIEWLNSVNIDKHRSIAKWIKENHSAILHVYDIWHVAKSVRKMLESAAKLKDCENIQPWIQSIINHLYWSAVSTELEQGELIVAKLAYVVNHVINKHKHNNELFSKCGSKALLQIEEICLKRHF